MSETLHDCPKCGGRNFTAHGIKSHNCTRRMEKARAIVAAQAKADPGKAGKILAVVPPANDFEMGVQLTAQYHRAVNAMPEILRFGAMMIRLREHLSGSNAHDGHKALPKGVNAKDGGVAAWLERHAPDVKRTTAQRFEGVTLSVMESYAEIVTAKVAKQITLPDLVTSDAAKLTPELAKKQQELFDHVAGTSQKSWLDKFRPAPSLGGARTRNPDKTYDPNAPVENARDLLLHPLRAIATRWREKEAKLPLWSHLPPEELREIDNILLDLRADLKAALKKGE